MLYTIYFKVRMSTNIELAEEGRVSITILGFGRDRLILAVTLLSAVFAVYTTKKLLSDYKSASLPA